MTYTQTPELVLGPTRGQVVRQVAAPLVGGLIGLVLYAVSAGHGVDYAAFGYPLGVVAVSPALARQARRQSVTVTPQGIAVRRGRRTCHLAWREVTSVDEVHTWGSSRVVVRTSTGRLRLRYPVSDPVAGRDSDFAAKVAGLRQWWAAYRWMSRPMR